VVLGVNRSQATFPPSLYISDLINDNAERYVGEQNKQNNNEKRRIQAAIIQAIEQGGGKFLKPSKANRRAWQRVSFEETRQKVAHALQYRIRACRGEVPEAEGEGAVAPTSPASSNGPELSRKRVAAVSSSSSGERSNRKKTTTRTVAAARPSANNAIGIVSSTDEEEPQSSFTGRSVPQYEQESEYHPRGYDQPQGYGQQHHQQQQQQGGFFGARAYYASTSFEDYHPYDLPEQEQEDPTNDFLPIHQAMSESSPFDAFNAGFTVIPVFDGSSDSDESSELLRWSDQQDE
jgi:hypothetical protein